MDKIVGAVSFAALIGFLICVALLASDGLKFGFEDIWRTHLGQMTLGFGLSFSHTFPIAMLLTHFKTPRHIRVYQRALSKADRKGTEALTMRERTCLIAYQAYTLLELDGLDAGVRKMSADDARSAVVAFNAIGLPRLALMFGDYLDAKQAGAFDDLTRDEIPTYTRACRAIEGRMESAGLKKVPLMLDEVLRGGRWALN